MSDRIKSRPILFSTLMVNAILSGSKTQTRRIMKPQPDQIIYLGGKAFPFCLALPPKLMPHAKRSKSIECKFGKVGDRLWVRETIWQWGSWVANGKAKSGKPKKKFKPIGRHVVYVADCPDYPKEAPDLGRLVHADEQWIKRPAIFMPRWACRIEREITGIRVERLNAISDADAVNEGIESFTKDGELLKWWPCEPCEGPIKCAWADLPRKPSLAFQELWKSINGPDSWALNPWVWIVDFERLTP